MRTALVIDIRTNTEVHRVAAATITEAERAAIAWIWEYDPHEQRALIVRPLAK